MKPRSCAGRRGGRSETGSPRNLIANVAEPSWPGDHARDDLPKLDRYPDGQTLPTPQQIDFTPGALLGSVSGELGLRKFLEGNGHQFVVISDKDGPGCAFERELPSAEIVISQPFWPAYLTAERIALAPGSNWRPRRGLGRTTSISRPRPGATLPSPRGPTATASARPSTP